MQLFEFAIHITIAVILGAAIGVERQWRQRQAGLRTNALVSAGAAAFVPVSLFVEGSTDPSSALDRIAGCELRVLTCHDLRLPLRHTWSPNLASSGRSKPVQES